jgi:hypothetical protein
MVTMAAVQGEWAMIAPSDSANRIDLGPEGTRQNRLASGDEKILRVARLLGRQAAEDAFRQLRPANDNDPVKMEWSLAS